MHTRSKVWLITGSSRGLGRAFAQAALDAGHRVVATARNPLQLSDLVSNYGDTVRALALDVTSEAQARHAIDTAIETFGGPGCACQQRRLWQRMFRGRHLTR